MSSQKPNLTKSTNPVLETTFNSEDVKDLKKSYNPNDEEHLDDDELNKSGSDIEVNTTIIPLKITMIGSSYVGKTSILKRYLHNQFEKDSTSATINVAFHNKKIKVDPYTFADLKIWDTAGQEQYRALTKSYINGSNGILIVFDLTNEKSFNDLNSWMDEIKNAIDVNKVEMILVGNKSDLPDQKVDKEQALKFAKDNNMDYQIVSAKDGINIESLFEKIGNDCVKILQEEQKTLEMGGKDINDKGQRISNLSGQFENNINNEKLLLNENVDNENKNRKCC